MLAAIKNAFSSLTGSTQKSPHLLMMGLDAAGKTTMMYKFREYEILHYPRFATESAKVLGTEIFSFDPLPVREGATDPHSIAKREFVKSEVAKADALVWVIDSTDQERFDESKFELERILNLKASATIPILILANKQDLPNFVPVEQISNRFNLQALKNPWNIFPTMANSGENLYEAFEWLLLTLKDQGFKIHHALEPVVRANCEIKPNS